MKKGGVKYRADRYYVIYSVEAEWCSGSDVMLGVTLLVTDREKLKSKDLQLSSAVA